MLEFIDVIFTFQMLFSKKSTKENLRQFVTFFEMVFYLNADL